MDRERSTPPPSEQKPTPVDISDRVRAMFKNPNQREAIEESMALQKDIKNIPFLTLTLDYTTLDHAKFLKALLFCKENLKMENGNLQSVPLNLK